MREVRGLEFKSQAGQILRKRFSTASTSTQVAVFPWRYDAKMGTANTLHASAGSNIASILKGFDVREYNKQVLTKNDVFCKMN